jgi:hypothetical protein
VIYQHIKYALLMVVLAASYILRMAGETIMLPWHAIKHTTKGYLWAHIEAKVLYRELKGIAYES